jgi:hypothetical protein|nr:MAG TPA: hypothetical protein [Bacteriophage sp.]
MRLDYEVILEKGNYALIKRGSERFQEYSIVAGLVTEQERKFEGSDWDGTVAAYDVNARGLSDALDHFRYITELNYITRARFAELATKFKDKFIEMSEDYQLTKEGIEYELENLELDDYEMEFFGLNGDEE